MMLTLAFTFTGAFSLVFLFIVALGLDAAADLPDERVHKALNSSLIMGLIGGMSCGLVTTFIAFLLILIL